MKKITLLSIALILVNTFIAQKIAIGPEIGINLIQTESTELGNDYQLGYNFGIQINYNFNKKFSLSSGIYASQKKKRYTFIDTTTTPDIVGGLIGGIIGGGLGGSSEANVYETTKGLVSEIYLGIPILLHYKINKVRLFAGPYLDFLLSVNRKEISTSESTAMDITTLLPEELGGIGNLLSNLTSQPNTTPVESSSKEGLSSTDVGIITGIGYQMNNLQFNLMYTYGFLDYRTNTENETLDNHKIIHFSVAYLFKLKKKTTTSAPSFN